MVSQLPCTGRGPPKLAQNNHYPGSVVNAEIACLPTSEAILNQHSVAVLVGGGAGGGVAVAVGGGAGAGAAAVSLRDVLLLLWGGGENKISGAFCSPAKSD